ncbi:STAS domain-containing protein [Thalassotalea sp. G2M2-11]|uniref:STAS domain-containing protein n=1 Tax=Thalassotalea sp. G2M2-11 TaxID=2787627 RepID=UPI0019CFEACC
MDKVNVQQQGKRLVVTGELTRRTVIKRFEKQSTGLLNQQIQLIDLAKVTQSDTAGLAWLLLIIEYAKQQSISLKIINIPHELIKLAKLSAVDSFLPVE